MHLYQILIIQILMNHLSPKGLTLLQSLEEPSQFYLMIFLILRTYCHLRLHLPPFQSSNLLHLLLLFRLNLLLPFHLFLSFIIITLGQDSFHLQIRLRLPGPTSFQKLKHLTWASLLLLILCFIILILQIDYLHPIFPKTIKESIKRKP